MRKIVLASSNSGKIREVSAILADLNIQIIPQSYFNIPDIEETGLSFVENAILKARHCSLHSGLPSLADDSGLCVPILNGSPGIYSARYAGKHGDSAANINKLLAELTEFEGEQRAAYFECMMVMMVRPDDPVPLIAEGRVHGYIAQQRQGSYGFGYDPVFYLSQYQKTLAEISAEMKNKISHRANALAILKRQLVSALSLST